jgi:hypothetical protein
MGIEDRASPRYQDFARAKITELCCLPGFLEDVSKTGCKVRFSHVLDVDTDREYTLTVLPALRSGIREFELVVRPCWVNAMQDAMEVGFCVLHSPGLRHFTRYVDILAELEEEEIQEA